MASNFQLVTVDVPFGEIVKWDQDKTRRVRFSDEPGEFRELQENEKKQLSRETLLAYEIAEAAHAEKATSSDRSEDEWIERVIQNVQSGGARNRLKINGKDPDVEYRWLRPDTVGRYQNEKGYVVVGSGSERTLANSTGKGPHVIGDRGSEELILVKRSKRVAAAERREKKKKAAERRRSIEQEGRGSVEKHGFQSFGDDQKAAGFSED